MEKILPSFSDKPATCFSICLSYCGEVFDDIPLGLPSDAQISFRRLAGDLSVINHLHFTSIKRTITLQPLSSDSASRLA